MIFRFATIASLCLFVVARVDAQPGASEDPTSFVLRVNPQWAGPVNSVLAQIAQPMEINLPDGVSGSDLLAKVCGGFVTANPTEVSDSATGRKRLKAPACARITTNAEVMVREGDTLEGIAVRNGLLAQEGVRLKVSPSKSGVPRLMDPTKLQPGNVVTIPKMPVWTTVVVKDMVVDRTMLIEAIAKEMKCDANSAESCLVQRGVFVLEGSSPSRPPQAPPSPPIPRDPEPVQIELRGARPRVEAVVAEAELRSLSITRVSTTAMASVVGASAPETMLEAIPVAPSQWPYDVDLLAAVLEDQKTDIRGRAIIGVADGGLRDALGAPLPRDVFQANKDELVTPGDDTNQRDDDDNTFVDDVFGAGEKRDLSELDGSGDLSLCPSPEPPFSNWTGDPLQAASHGAVVVSMAAGLKIRVSKPAVADLLPRVVFYRLLPKACGPQSSFDTSEGAATVAFEYLEHRRNADVISLSYRSRTGYSSTFKEVMESKLERGELILVMAAGNDVPGDLDRYPFCPQCLGSDTNAKRANRTMVVGAATRDLTLSAYTNHGDRTVAVYAPGEPFGAVNLLGQDVSFWQPSTSYAAPYAALAVGILRSFGYKKARDIRDRLAAATWPLQGVSWRIGVIDLVKAAAVRRHVVEVVEAAPDGVLQRKTYVGTLLRPLNELSICAGNPFYGTKVQAIRLYGNIASNERRVVVYKKNDHNVLTGRREIVEIPNACRPSGEVKMRILPGGAEKSFPLTAVTQIQVPYMPE